MRFPESEFNRSRAAAAPKPGRAPPALRGDALPHQTMTSRRSGHQRLQRKGPSANHVQSRRVWSLQVPSAACMMFSPATFSMTLARTLPKQPSVTVRMSGRMRSIAAKHRGLITQTIRRTWQICCGADGIVRSSMIPNKVLHSLPTPDGRRHEHRTQTGQTAGRIPRQSASGDHCGTLARGDAFFFQQMFGPNTVRQGLRWHPQTGRAMRTHNDQNRRPQDLSPSPSAGQIAKEVGQHGMPRCKNHSACRRHDSTRSRHGETIFGARTQAGSRASGLNGANPPSIIT
jgi:hypothetical protein